MMTLNTLNTALLVSTATAESSDDTTRTLLLTAGLLGFLIACPSGIAMSVISGKAKKNDEPMEQSTRTRVFYWLNIAGFGIAFLAYSTMFFLGV